jgi:hypothetical protein
VELFASLFEAPPITMKSVTAAIPRESAGIHNSSTGKDLVLRVLLAFTGWRTAGIS